MTYTIAKLAERYSVDRHVITALIASGELVAINVAKNPRGPKPRWDRGLNNFPRNGTALSFG